MAVLILRAYVIAFKVVTIRQLTVRLMLLKLWYYSLTGSDRVHFRYDLPEVYELVLPVLDQAAVNPLTAVVLPFLVLVLFDSFGLVFKVAVPRAL